MANIPEEAEIAEELVLMKRADQDLRLRNLKNPNYWDQRVDRKHTNKMREIVAKIGWPTITKVGVEGSSAAWLLIQHADHDILFQKECLNLMKNTPQGEVQLSEIAYLEDRVRVNCGQLQLYGTQFVEVNGVFEPRPIEDRSGVDARRLQMGLGTLREGIEHMKKKYNAK